MSYFGKLFKRRFTFRRDVSNSIYNIKYDFEFRKKMEPVQHIVKPSVEEIGMVENRKREDEDVYDMPNLRNCTIIFRIIDSLGDRKIFSIFKTPLYSST